MKRGFTLVELSIVLVIIGLLIGGILTAQSMISTAKIQSVIKQYSQWDISLANFRTKYNQLPGDGRAMGGTGDNDGNIISSAEWQSAWSHLSIGTGLKNIKNNNFIIDVVNIGNADETMCPRLNIDQDNSGVHCILMVNGSVGGMTAANKKNYYRDYTANYNTSSPGGLIAPKNVLAIDSKLDDGLPLSGLVLVSTTGGSIQNYSSPQCYTGTKYTPENNSYSCALFVEMGISTGTQ